MTEVLNPARFLIIGFEGLTPSDEFLRLIEEGPPAGFLLLGHNYRDPEQLCDLAAELKAACGRKILLAVDQEPGRVQRFKAGFPASKKPSHYLKQGNTAEFRAWCGATADTLASAGVNMNFAPVVDMAESQREYPVLKDRVFGDEPGRVAEFASILIEEFKVRKIATCAKHFPGLGCGEGDPHDVLTRSGESLERFLDYHWKPFKAAARAGVDCMMTTHLLAPAIDPDNCATYSKNAVGHLRNTIGFRGPVVSDDLFMAGANAGDAIGSAAIESLSAGHNLLIISKTADMLVGAREAIRKRCSEDDAFRKAATENVKKVEAFIDEL